MAAKKAASRTRSTTKRGKTTRTTTKRTAKPRSAAKPAPADDTSTIEISGVAEPETSTAPTDERPSRFMGDHYLHVAGPEPEDGSARRPGKWLVFVSRSRIDALWDTVRRAVKAGRLGHAAKVSTALPDPHSPDPKKHVICVYTSDEEDATDVRRVRTALRELGVSWRIPYKADAATVAKYYE